MASTTETATSRSSRLSKPRTTSYSNLLRLAEQQHEPSLRPSSSSIYESSDQLTVVASAATERRGRRVTRSKIRTYFHGASSEKSQAWSSDEEEEEQRGFTDIARGVRDRLSRVGTRPSISQLPSAGASTSQLSNCSSSYLELTLEESARVAEEIKEKAYMDRIAAYNHVSSPVDEDLHVDAMQSPIRRKSLYTPGIATRTPDDILQKLPPPPEETQAQADREYYFNPNKPESSPLGRLASLEIGEGGRSTPSNLDYSHLGGLKLGTLRVTNGTATPVPHETSPARLRTSASFMMENEEFFTASEGNKSQDEARISSISFSSDNEVHQRTGDSQTQLEEQTPNTVQDRGRTQNSSRSPRRVGSPLKYEHEIEDDDAPTKPSRQAHSKWLERKHSLPPGFSFESPDQALMIAYDYMKDLPDSPFSCAEILSISSSKTGHTSNLDEDKDSFEDEGVVISKSNHPEVEIRNSSSNDKEFPYVDHGTREDAFRRLNSNAAAQHTPVNHRVLSTAVSGDGSRKIARLEAATTTKTMSKADSGYSSSESLNSLSLVAPKDTEDSMSDHTPAVRPRVSSCVLGSQKMPKSNLRRLTLIIPRAPRAESVPAIKMSPVTDLVSTSKPAVDPSPRSRSRLRKLSKARRSSQPPPVDSIFVQGIRNLSQIEIPPVPSDVAMRHNERLLRFPLLQHTYPSLHHINSNDSLSNDTPTVMPIQFPSPANSMKRATSICNTNLDWPSKRSPKSEKDKSRSRSSSKNRNKMNRQSSQGETLTTIADFGTVTESLGNSPYDAARSAMLNPWDANTARLSYQSQTSNSSSRPRGTDEIKEEADVEYNTLHSRRKSQSCSRPLTHSDTSYESRNDSPVKAIRPRSMIFYPPNDPAISTSEPFEPKKQSFSRQFDNSCERSNDRGRTLRMSSRPRSMFIEAPPVPALPSQDVLHQKIQNFSKPFEPRRKSFDDRGGVPGRLLRPQTISVDVPPIPLLPTKEQLEQREAQIIRSNSTKSKILPPPVQAKKLANNLIEDNPRDHESLIQEEKRFYPQGSWELPRKAWSQRRKSAGDALLFRDQATQHSEASKSIDVPNTSSEKNKSLREAASTISQEPKNLMNTTRPGPRPLSQFQAPSSMRNESTTSQSFKIPRKALTIQPGNFEHDRYSGGLSYGYEPGFGLGGSAGTRSLKTGASRKSIDVSRGYGLDLTDVPIFVAPS